MKLNIWDRFLTLFIFAAMLIGFGIGWIPGFKKFDSVMTVDNLNIIIVIGMVLMLIPPFLKIKFTAFFAVFKDWKVILISLFLNLVIGPFLMFGLAIGILDGNSETAFRTGVIVVGIARCIAMVVVWNTMAKGDAQYANALVAINSLFQLIFFMPLVILFSNIMPDKMGFEIISVHTNFVDVIKTMGIFLFLPFGIAMFIKLILWKVKSGAIKTNKIISRIGFFALLITILYIFASKSTEFKSDKLIPIAKTIAILICYFIIMWFFGILLSFIAKFDYQKAITVTTTGMGNNFELAIAVSLSWFYAYKDVSLAATIGPLVEVPIMVGFTKLNLWLKTKWDKKFPPKVVEENIKNSDISTENIEENKNSY